MHKHRHITSLIITLVLLSMATEQRLSAYVDPGSGAMFVQIILAGLIGILYRIRGVFSRVRKRRTEEVPDRAFIR